MTRFKLALVVGSLGLLGFSPAAVAQTPAAASVVYAKPGQILRFQVLVRPTSGIVINHRAPNQLRVSPSWAASDRDHVVISQFSGELWPERPEFYWQRLRPATISLRVPNTLTAGEHQLTLSGQFGLCHGPSGVCFVGKPQAHVTLMVGQTQQAPTFTLWLAPPAGLPMLPAK
jgi:hypothetical protein